MTLALFSPLRWHEQRRLHRIIRVRVSRSAESSEPYTEFATNFAGFCREVLGVAPWQKQEEIAQAILDHPKTAVSACYAAGKSMACAMVCLWWCYTRRPSFFVTTAPTQRQVRKILFREIRKLHRAARRPLPGKVLAQEVFVADDWQGFGFASSTPDSAQGLHEAENVLFIEDEASGIDAEIVAGFDGITASPGSRHLKVGNPVCSAGAPFFNCFHKPGEREVWHKITISALDTPNVLAGRVVVPGLVTREWVEDARKRWGENSPLWKMKVLGQFITDAGGDQVVPPEWVLAAQERWATFAPHDGWPKTLGVDVALGGEDETVLYLLDGGRLTFVAAWQMKDSMEQARKIVAVAAGLGVAKINGDATGPGKGLWDRILELQSAGALKGVEINALEVQKAACDRDGFPQLCDEIQWEARKALDPASAFPVAIDPQDSDLATELSLRTWSLTNDGKIKCESKRDLRRRGEGSPDRADSAILCFYKAKRVWFF